MSSVILINIFLSLFGLLIGSFLNALIHRLPREIPFGLSRSFCPKCETIIKWYQNIPILSFLVLRGRCANCHEKISWRYLLVEVITFLFTIIILPRNYTTMDFVYFFFFFSIGCSFIVHFFVDLEHKILPNQINLFLGVILFFFSVFNYDWKFWSLGFLIGLGFPLLVTWLFYVIRGQIGLGGGDIKLFAVLGFYLGPFGIIMNIFLSCLLGSIIGLSLMLFKKMDKDNPLPFGPAILIIASIQIFIPDLFAQIVSYIGLAH